MSTKTKTSQKAQKLRKTEQKQIKEPHEKKRKAKNPSVEFQIPRGERANFLRLSITMPANMLSALRNVGMKRKEEKMKDTDVSALIREAVAEFLNKN